MASLELSNHWYYVQPSFMQFIFGTRAFCGLSLFAAPALTSFNQIGLRSVVRHVVCEAFCIRHFVSQIETRGQAMRVTGDQLNLNSASSRMRSAARETAASEAAKADASVSSSRALIPLSPVRYSERTQTVVRQPANFLAHLIATKQSIPQTRERRRVEPNVAASIYAAADEPGPAKTSHKLSRAM
jgi:hypothetical protein